LKVTCGEPGSMTYWRKDNVRGFAFQYGGAIYEHQKKCPCSDFGPGHGLFDHIGLVAGLRGESLI